MLSYQRITSTEPLFYDKQFSSWITPFSSQKVFCDELMTNLKSHCGSVTFDFSWRSGQIRHRTVFFSDEQVIRHGTAFVLWLMQSVINFVMEDAATWHTPHWQPDVASCHAAHTTLAVPRVAFPGCHVSASSGATCHLLVVPRVVFRWHHVSTSGRATCSILV